MPCSARVVIMSWMSRVLVAEESLVIYLFFVPSIVTRVGISFSAGSSLQFVQWTEIESGPIWPQSSYGQPTMDARALRSDSWTSGRMRTKALDPLLWPWWGGSSSGSSIRRPIFNTNWTWSKAGPRAQSSMSDFSSHWKWPSFPWGGRAD